MTIRSDGDTTRSDDRGLREGAIGLPDLFMQAIGHMAPALGTVTTLAFVGSLAGIVAPVAFVIAGAACLLVAVTLQQLARKIAGAGGFFTYLSHSFGPRAGFFTAWAYFLYDPLVTGALFAFSGSLVEETLQARFGWAPPWWSLFLVGAIGVSIVSWFAVAVSVRVLMVLVAIEVVVFGALAVTGLLNPGPGGFNFESFDPTNAPADGLYLAVIFTILAYTGFESVAPLAEETKNPRRNLPIAILGSLAMAVAFYTFESWGLMVGWGTDDIGGFVASPAPLFDLGERLWGGGWLIVLLATVSSTLALCTATHSAATRVFFSMGRAGALPARLARVHPKYGTPSNAIILQTLLTLLSGLGISALIGPQENFFLVGLMLTMSLILIFCLANAGVCRLYLTKYKSEFNVVLHLLVPIASSLILLWVGFKSLEDLNILQPEVYLDWAPTLVVGWLVIGAALLVIFKWVGHDDWSKKINEGIEDDGDIADEFGIVDA